MLINKMFKQINYELRFLISFYVTTSSKVIFRHTFDWISHGKAPFARLCTAAVLRDENEKVKACVVFKSLCKANA